MMQQEVAAYDRVPATGHGYAPQQQQHKAADHPIEFALQRTRVLQEHVAQIGHCAELMADRLIGPVPQEVAGRAQ